MEIMRDALIAAGFDCEENIKPYERISEVQLPFGSCVGNIDDLLGTDHYSNILNGINYYRSGRTEFNLDDYPVSIQGVVYDWLKDNHSICSIVPKAENLPDRDLKYGGANVVFAIKYYTQFEMFKYHFNVSALNFDNPVQNKIKHLADNTLLDWSDYSTKYNDAHYESNWDWFVENIIPKCEFIPVYIVTGDGCKISNDEQGFASPCLGKNIKKHPDIMSKLENWLMVGELIIDDKFYIILEDSDSDNGALCLREWIYEKEKYKYINRDNR